MSNMPIRGTAPKTSLRHPCRPCRARGSRCTRGPLAPLDSPCASCARRGITCKPAGRQHSSQGRLHLDPPAQPPADDSGGPAAGVSRAGTPGPSAAGELPDVVTIDPERADAWGTGLPRHVTSWLFTLSEARAIAGDAPGDPFAESVRQAVDSLVVASCSVAAGVGGCAAEPKQRVQGTRAGPQIHDGSVKAAVERAIKTSDGCGAMRHVTLDNMVALFALAAMLDARDRTLKASEPFLSAAWGHFRTALEPPIPFLPFANPLLLDASRSLSRYLHPKSMTLGWSYFVRDALLAASTTERSCRATEDDVDLWRAYCGSAAQESSLGSSPGGASSRHFTHPASGTAPPSPSGEVPPGFQEHGAKAARRFPGRKSRQKKPEPAPESEEPTASGEVDEPEALEFLWWIGDGVTRLARLHVQHINARSCGPSSSRGGKEFDISFAAVWFDSLCQLSDALSASLERLAPHLLRDAEYYATALDFLLLAYERALTHRLSSCSARGPGSAVDEARVEQLEQLRRQADHRVLKACWAILRAGRGGGDDEPDPLDFAAHGSWLVQQHAATIARRVAYAPLERAGGPLGWTQAAKEDALRRLLRVLRSAQEPCNAGAAATALWLESRLPVAAPSSTTAKPEGEVASGEPPLELPVSPKASDRRMGSIPWPGANQPGL